jgi:hypothetical protein
LFVACFFVISFKWYFLICNGSPNNHGTLTLASEKKKSF